MEQLTNESAILRVLYRFTHAQDLLDVATMASLLAPNRKIKFDLSKHFPEVGNIEGSASEIANILYDASAGWTATQHPVYNTIVTSDPQDPNRASVQAMVQAYHCLETDGQVEALTVHATWFLEMECINSNWVMADMAIVRDVPIANIGLFQKMRERMMAGVKRQPFGAGSA